MGGSSITGIYHHDIPVIKDSSNFTVCCSEKINGEMYGDCRIICSRRMADERLQGVSKIV